MGSPAQAAQNSCSIYTSNFTQPRQIRWRNKPSVLIEPNFLTAVRGGHLSHKAAHLLVPLLETKVWPSAAIVNEPLLGIDWRHPVWTHRREHLSKRHPWSLAFGNMYESLVQNLAAPPWTPDLTADCHWPSCFVWRVPDEVTREIRSFSGASMPARPSMWFGKSWSWRLVWEMWEHNQLTVLVSFMHMLPQTPLLQAMRQAQKRLQRFHGDYVPRRATQLVYAEEHRQFFSDQNSAYERLLQLAPTYAHAQGARQKPRSDLSLGAGKQAPLLTEAAAGFAARLLQQYDRLVVARHIHYFVQRCHLRGKQSGTIRLENTAMLLSQKGRASKRAVDCTPASPSAFYYSSSNLSLAGQRSRRDV